MKVDVAASAREAHLEDQSSGPTRRMRVFGAVALGMVLVPTTILRFVAPPDLWLDEALSVNIANLPLNQLRVALAHDGAPPLYYVLLHGWMSIFGTSSGAVRALSGGLGVIAVGLAFVAGGRLGRTAPERRWLAASAGVVVAASPYAIRYSTEARMYSLTILLVFLGVVFVADAWATPTAWRLARVSLVTAALLYTQYWSFFLLALVGLGLLVCAVGAKPMARNAARRLVVALAAGGLLFVPWIPTLRTQLAHTGTPWDTPASPVVSSYQALVAFGGRRVVEGWILATVLLAVALLGILLRSAAGGRLVTTARVLAGLGFGTVVFGICVSALTENGFQDRYAAVGFPLVALSVAIGVLAVRDVRARIALVSVIAVLGIVGGIRAARDTRTASGSIASALHRAIQPGDVVAYCPDQLGPSTARLLPPSTRQATFPDLADPQFVDWTAYADRNAAGSPARFARRVTRMAGAGRVYLVWSPGYRTLGTRCEGVVNQLGRIRPVVATITNADGPNGEQVELRRFDP